MIAEGKVMKYVWKRDPIESCVEIRIIISDYELAAAGDAAGRQLLEELEQFKQMVEFRYGQPRNQTIDRGRPEKQRRVLDLDLPPL